VTNKLSDKEIIGIAKVFIPNIAINAMYDDPPPRPTDEYVNATIKKRTAKKYGDGIIMSIVFSESLCRLYILASDYTDPYIITIVRLSYFHSDCVICQKVIFYTYQIIVIYLIVFNR